MKKKFLAGLLSLAMLLTLLPVSAFAAEAISGTITAEPDTVTAVLSSASADPDFTYTVTLGGYALPDAEQAADSTKDVTLTLPQTVDGTTTNYTSTVTLTYKVADDVASWELPTDQISFASGDPSTELLKATVAGTVATAAPQTEQYTIKFAAGDGATGEMADATQAKAETGDTTYTIPDSTFTAPTGKVFDKWTTDVGTVDGATLTIPAATETTDPITLTATWKDASSSGDQPVGDVAITLIPADGIAVGDTLPDAQTTNENVTLSTKWTNEAGDEVTKAESAGKYAATIEVTAKAGFELGTVKYTIDGEEVTAAETTATLTKEYTVEASAPKEYNVTVNSEPTIGGTAAANVEKAAEGAEVTVTITPAEGYKVDTVTMGGTVVEDVTDNVFTFTMPAADVLVQVIFVEETTVNAEVSAPAADATGETSVSNDVVAAAIEKAKEDAGVEGNATVGKVEITAEGASRITLDQQAVETLTEAESVTVKAEAGEVTLPKEILNENKTKSLTLVVEEATRPDVAAAVEIKASYEVKVESNGQEVPVSNLSKPIKLRFTIDTNLTGEPTLAYFDTVSKKIKAIASSVYYPNTGVIEGEITHLTQIVVADKADVDDTQEPAVTVKYQIGSNEAVTLTGTSAAVTVDADVENIKITVDGATQVTVNGEAYTSGGNTVALNEGANTITIVADDQTYTLTVTRESATTPEYTELTADNFSFTTTLTDEEKAKFYQGKLTITGLDSGKTYVVTYEHQNATGNTIPRIAHVVENPAGGEIELSCQSTMGVMVFEVIGSNVTSDLTCIFESAKHKGVPVTTFKAS